MVNYKEYQKLSQQRIQDLEEVIRAKEIELKNAPEGQLRVAKCKNSIQYFVRHGAKDNNGTYIRSKNLNMAIELAQKEYDEKVLTAAKNEIKLLKKMDALYSNIVVETVPARIAIRKMALVNTVVKSDEDYIKDWLAQKYVSNNSYPENLKFVNSKGIRMRSKSELLISSILDEYNIPYLYEKPLRLGEYKMVSPDFTLLDIRNRKEVYLEHLGMLNDVDYMLKNMEKIKSYEDNGFYLGKQLLLTYETRDCPINTKAVRGLIENYFS